MPSFKTGLSSLSFHTFSMGYFFFFFKGFKSLSVIYTEYLLVSLPLHLLLAFFQDKADGSRLP